LNPSPRTPCFYRGWRGVKNSWSGKSLYLSGLAGHEASAFFLIFQTHIVTPDCYPQRLKNRIFLTNKNTTKHHHKPLMEFELNTPDKNKIRLTKHPKN